MHPNIFDSEEQAALKSIVSAVKYLPIWDSSEFEEIFGLSRAEVMGIESSFPNWDLRDEGVKDIDDSWLAVNNAFAWLMNGTEDEKAILRKEIALNDEQLASLYKKFKRL